MSDSKHATGRSATRASSLRKELRIDPGARVSLASLDPGATFGFTKESADATVAHNLERLASLQERVWAEHHHRILIVLQGIDASGKDGTIRHVMSAFNPQGCSVVNFGVPSALELAHDFLWRVHAAVPGNGDVVIFNRSHYESVIVERVHSLVPKAVWSTRFAAINAFEELLIHEGTTVIKLFLAIDRDEQRARLEARYDDPTKRWKFQLGDLEERKRWPEYIEAFDDALARCSTAIAPWYVIPANHKWFRNLAVGQIVADVLEDLRPAYPARDDLPRDLTIE